MNSKKDDIIYEKILKAQSGDAFSKDALICENTGLVLSIAKRFYGRGYDNDEINQLGFIGLYRAIERFDISKNVRFSTFAVPHILGEIKVFLRDDGPIKVSRSIKKTASDIARFIENEQKTKGVAPKINSIADALGLTTEEIITAQEAMLPPESISAEDRKEELLKSDEGGTDLLTKIDMGAAISSLPKKEQTIISMRYFEDKSQKCVAEKLGISQVQVSRLEKKILKALRERLECES